MELALRKVTDVDQATGVGWSRAEAVVSSRGGSQVRQHRCEHQKSHGAET